MGTLAFFLAKYNTLRNPRTFFINRPNGPYTQVHLGHRIRAVTNFALDTLYKNERRVNYGLGTPYLRAKYVSFLVYFCPNVFLGTFSDAHPKANLFQGSFRQMKKHVCFYAKLRDFSKLPSYTTRFTRLRHFPRFMFYCLTLNRYFLTKTARFTLSLKIGRAITPLAQFHLYMTKLSLASYAGLRWGVYFYPQSSLLGYYRAVASNGLKNQRRSRFYAEGLLDFLNEEDFPDLMPTAPTITQVGEPHVERTCTPDTFTGSPLFYLRNEAFSKGRYARNRQTYRTGVLWCVWLTVLTVVLPSYLWYGITVKFTYLWPVFMGSLVGVVGLYFWRLRRWSTHRTSALVETFSKWFIN